MPRLHGPLGRVQHYPKQVNHYFPTPVKTYLQHLQLTGTEHQCIGPYPIHYCPGVDLLLPELHLNLMKKRNKVEYYLHIADTPEFAIMVTSFIQWFQKEVESIGDKIEP